MKKTLLLSLLALLVLVPGSLSAQGTAPGGTIHVVVPIGGKDANGKVKEFAVDANGNFKSATVPALSWTSPLVVENAAALGTTSLSVAAGTYTVFCKDETVFVCDSDDGGSGTDCATLGTPLVSGSQYGPFRQIATATWYFRSAGGTGDCYFVTTTP